MLRGLIRASSSSVRARAFATREPNYRKKSTVEALACCGYKFDEFAQLYRSIPKDNLNLSHFMAVKDHVFKTSIREIKFKESERNLYRSVFREIFRDVRIGQHSLNKGILITLVVASCNTNDFKSILKILELGKGKLQQRVVIKILHSLKRHYDSVSFKDIAAFECLKTILGPAKSLAKSGKLSRDHLGLLIVTTCKAAAQARDFLRNVEPADSPSATDVRSLYEDVLEIVKNCVMNDWLSLDTNICNRALQAAMNLDVGRNTVDRIELVMNIMKKKGIAPDKVTLNHLLSAHRASPEGENKERIEWWIAIINRSISGGLASSMRPETVRRLLMMDDFDGALRVYNREPRNLNCFEEFINWFKSRGMTESMCDFMVECKSRIHETSPQPAGSNIPSESDKTMSIVKRNRIVRKAFKAVRMVKGPINIRLVNFLWLYLRILPKHPKTNGPWSQELFEELMLVHVKLAATHPSLSSRRLNSILQKTRNCVVKKNFLLRIIRQYSELERVDLLTQFYFNMDRNGIELPFRFAPERELKRVQEAVAKVKHNGATGQKMEKLENEDVKAHNHYTPSAKHKAKPDNKEYLKPAQGNHDLKAQKIDRDIGTVPDVGLC
ncbi:hypothetical protein AAMO2058_000193100 [Amorphochlora amoebiformis]